jgi:DNA-binding GntR family transcriptional regulator
MDAAALIRELAPQNVMEAMLAAQMIATNDAVLMFLNRSTSQDQSTEAADANVLRATRLMRVFTQQTEAMQKLKGKAGQPRLSVEQVNVHQGGQAIVGSISTSRQEGQVT